MTLNRHKMALLTWAIVYPLITIILTTLEPVLSGIALPVRTLILTLLIVPILVYVAMPFATDRFKGWLRETQILKDDGRTACVTDEETKSS